MTAVELAAYRKEVCVCMACAQQNCIANVCAHNTKYHNMLMTIRLFDWLL